MDIPPEFVKKITTFNGGEIFFLFDPAKHVESDWQKRLICSLCFTKEFFHNRGVKLPEIPYIIYVCSSATETKALIFEASNGKFHLQPNAVSATIGGRVFADQKASPIMDIHEYIHILMDNLMGEDYNKYAKILGPGIPMWYKEGMAQYIQGEKDGTDFFAKARELPYLPPVTLKVMNIPTEKFWLEFGIMDQYMLTGNHPGLIACASFIKFLVEKEKVDFKKVWNLVNFKGEAIEFYNEIEKLCGNSLFNISNNYLYYLDKPTLSFKEQNWSMPVSVARDFRNAFVFENKSFEFLNMPLNER